MAGIEKEVEAMILAGLGKGEDESRATLPADPTTEQEEEGEKGAKRILDVDLFRLPDGGVLLLPKGGANPLDKNAVESDVASDPVTETPTVPLTEDGKKEEIPQELEAGPAGKHRRMKPSYVFVPLLLLFILTAGTVISLFLLPLSATADVTIIPLTRSLHKEATLTIASSTQNGAVQGRSLAAMSLTKSESVPATGHGHDDASQATGVITFYNADSQSYTIPAGVSFAAQNGATVVTDQVVTIQAAVPPSFGTGITPANAVQAGSIGNIPAHAIDTRCCGSAFITATNVIPFTGGQDARDYTYIQSRDIRNASQDLLSSLTPLVTTALAKLAHPGESIVTPLCNPHTTSSAEAGAEALSVTVSVTQTCTALAYSLVSLEQTATALLARSTNLANYAQAGIVQVTINGSTYSQQRAKLTVSLSGTWVYRFTQSQLTRFKRMIAGVSKAKAQASLLSEPGIAQVSIQVHRLDFKDLLPPNPENIHLVFITLL